jgi:hypothetical protein
MVGSRHSSLRLPSTTVRASTAPRCPWAGVTSPAGQPNSQASTSAVTSRGTDQGWSGGAVDGRRTPPRRSATLPERGPISGGAGSGVGAFAGPVAGLLADSLARRMVRSTRAASDHRVAGGWPVSAGRMRTSFVVDPGAWMTVWQRSDAGRKGRGSARAGGSPQRVGGAGRRARGHAQDPFSLGVRRGSRPWVAFRCGMAMREGAVTGAGCQADRPKEPAFIGSQPSRAAPVARSTWLIGAFRLWFGRLWCLRPPSTALLALDKRRTRRVWAVVALSPVVRERSSTT